MRPVSRANVDEDGRQEGEFEHFLNDDENGHGALVMLEESALLVVVPDVLFDEADKHRNQVEIGQGSVDFEDLALQLDCCAELGQHI